MAEIRQKIISCSQGHYYDANRYDSCPYCNSGSFSPTVDPFAPQAQGVSSTVCLEGAGAPLGQNYGGFSPTLPPQQPERVSSAMGKTQYVDSSTPAGAPAPVVGWLVAVSGPCRGTDYRIHTGYNYIGREAGDICIRGDSTISAEKDANITYVPQTMEFYIAHELGKNVLLVNDRPVIGGSMKLDNYDIVTIGSTKLMFVGLCGKDFNWGSEGKEHE